MTPDQLAERIMDRIQKDQAIHKSSIIDELQLACAPVVRPMPQRDGYPIETVHTVDANLNPTFWWKGNK